MSPKQTLVWIGTMQGGQVRLDRPADYARFREQFADGERVEATLKRYQDTRSARANRYLWGVVYAAIAEDTGQEPESIHEAMKERFLVKTDIVFVNAKTGEMEEHRVVGSSAGLKVSEFYQFVENVRLFAGEWLGLRIPDPNEVSL